MIIDLETAEALTDDELLDRLRVDEGIALWRDVKEVGQRKLLAAREVLVEILSKEDPYFAEQNLRAIAAGSLASLGFDVLLPYLVQLESSGELLRVGLADTLGETRDQRATPYLVRLATDESDEVVLFAALGLAKVYAVPEIASLLSAPQLGFKRTGYLLDALVKIGGSEAEEVYEAHLAECPPDVQAGFRKLFGR